MRMTNCLQVVVAAVWAAHFGAFAVPSSSAAKPVLPEGYTASVQADDCFALPRAEFAKYYRQITGRDAPEGMVNFAIDPKVSKSGRDAYSIVSGNAAVAGRPPYRGGEKGRAGSPLPAADAQKHIPPVEFSAPWNVSFQSDALHRGPKESLVTDQLVDFSTSTDSALKYYSGRITYKTKFRYGRPAGTSSVPRVVLDLGEVAVTAKVKINGNEAGGVCFAPHRLDVTPFVREGENNLEIEVCNLWANRLVGDDGDPDRPTWTSKECCGKSTKLPKSGLLGPVRIFAATKKQ